MHKIKILNIRYLLAFFYEKEIISYDILKKDILFVEEKE